MRSLVGPIVLVASLVVTGCATTGPQMCREYQATYRDATVSAPLSTESPRPQLTLELSTLGEPFAREITPALRAELPDGTRIMLGVLEHELDGSRCETCLDVVSTGNGVIEYDGQRHSVEGFRVLWRGSLEIRESSELTEIALVPDTVAVVDLPLALENIVRAPIEEQLLVVRPVVVRVRNLGGRSFIDAPVTSSTHLTTDATSDSRTSFRIPDRYMRRSAQTALRRENDRLTVADLVSGDDGELELQVRHWTLEGTCRVLETSLHGRLSDVVTLSDPNLEWLSSADLERLAHGIADTFPQVVVLTPVYEWSLVDGIWLGEPGTRPGVDLLLTALGGRCAAPEHHGAVVLEWTVDDAGRAQQARVAESDLETSTVGTCLIDGLQNIAFPPGAGPMRRSFVF